MSVCAKVAERAGATIGLITHDFASRAAMVQAAVEHARDISQEEIRWPTTLDRDEIIACLESFLPIGPSRRSQLSVLLAFQELTQTSPELQAIHQRIHSFMRDKDVNCIRLLGHSLKDARKIADALLVQCDGILVYALLNEKYWTPEHQRAIVAEAVDKVFNGDAGANSH